MSIHKIRDKYLIFKGEKFAEAKFRKELSELIISKFGSGPFDDQTIIREIAVFSLDYYISKFKEICLNERSVRFYQNVFWFHEQATELAILFPHEDHSSEIKGSYIAKYRRILKFIIELGCDVQMVTGEHTDKLFKKRMEPILHDLLFLGDMILMCVDLYAEQSMVDDAVEITFDKNDLYVYGRKHHYEYIFKHIINDLGSYLYKSVVDENGFNDFKNALKDCFDIKYDDVSHVIASIHKELEPQGGEIVGVGWDTLTQNLHNLFGVPLDSAEMFFRGLRLDNTNKMDLLSLACKPYSLNRYLYRPIIIWNIDGKDYALFGKNSWTESIIQYATNAIPWGKAPSEWIKNKCFEKYVHNKEDEHDKWLENEVEEKLNTQNLLYDRNVKNLVTLKGKVSIDVIGLGEVDFIIISEKVKKIFISDCKHLLGRFDIVNQKNDYNVFVVGSKNKKSYNLKMKEKIDWFNRNKHLLQEHFQFKYNNSNLNFDNYSIEGIFIINTPTFYMYNSDYRIYTISQIDEVFAGTYTDQTFMIVIEEEKSEKILNVSYPYFKKPTYVTFDPFIEEDNG